MSSTNDLSLSLATEQDLPQILTFIKALAEYERLADAVVFDGRNLYEPDDVEAAGLAYYGIGRGRSIRLG